MARTDYNGSLDVARDASEDQIRSAYRKLARQYHPDVNPSEDGATRFREVTEAYEVLSDPQRRQRFDMFGSTDGAAGFGIDDLFNTFFGGEMRRLLADPGHIDGVLRRGAERAAAIAMPVLREVQDITGLLRP